jgi:hypothetical protein
VFCDNSDFEIDAEEVGNIITVLSNFGGIKIGDEKIMEATAAPIVMMVNGFFHRTMKSRRLEELKSKPLLASSVIV